MNIFIAVILIIVLIVIVFGTLIRKQKKALSTAVFPDSYRAFTNRAEFFEVVSEYFFERPDLLEENHPELYGLLVKMFRQKPVVG